MSDSKKRTSKNVDAAPSIPEGPSAADMLAALQASQALIQQLMQKVDAEKAQNESLRAAVEAQSAAAANHQARLATAVPTHRTPGGELMVGVRNVSDNTVGVVAQFKGDPSLHLHADFGKPDPNSVAVISYTWWRELRKSPLVEKGIIMRDDDILGPGIPLAPTDGPHELPLEAQYNAVRDPKQWIDSRSEDEIRNDLDKVTSDATLRRLRRVVDDALRAIESKYPRNTIPEQVVAAKKALRELPGKLRTVDELITMRLERVDEEGEPVKTVIKS